MRGILINNTLHTGTDFNLVMTAKELPPPKMQSFTVSVPGRNGVLDLSEALTGEVIYDNRTLKFSFVGDGSREYVLFLIDKMLSYHGQYITITTDDYPEWFYTGRAEVSYNDKGYYAEITITVDAQPFRFKKTPKTFTYNTPDNQNIVLKNEGKPVIPTIIVTGDTTIVKGEMTYNLSSGTYELDTIKLSEGDNTITLTGSGTVTITYRERAI